MSSETIRIITRWLAGFGISLLLIWAITAVSTENLYPKVWSDSLNRNVPAPGWTFRNRGEAWATTRFGELGLSGTEKVEDSSVTKILIWGDSFVEAFQVPERERMHRQLSDQLAARGSADFQVIGVGRRFQSFADYIFQVPLYEKAIESCRLHVIHLHTLDDVYPDADPAKRISLFLTKPELHFVRSDNEYREIEAPATAEPMKEFVFRAQGQFFLRMKKRATQIGRLEGLRFSLGTQLGKSAHRREPGNQWSDYLNPEWVSLEAPRAAWEFAIDSLQATTEVPLLIVYAPATPTLHRGRVVEKNPEDELVKVFAEICRERGVGFVNLEEVFLRYQRETGRFPKGFQTSRPWEGHYNAEGHRLVAGAMHQWIEENAHVVYPD